MKRILIPSQAFLRAAKKVAKRNPRNEADIRATLALLSTDAYHPRLKTHKLQGEWEHSWACSAGYDVRIIFEFVKEEGKKGEDIFLIEIGTHDEVY